MKTLILALLSLLLLNTSCSIQKRQHLKGYTTHWNKGIKPYKLDDTFVLTNHSKSKFDTLGIQQIEISQTAVFSSKFDSLLMTNSNGDSIKCDEILFKTGDELLVQIIEVTPLEIKYKKCNYLDGPLFTVNKSSVFSVQYKNGERELIKTEKTITKDNSIVVVQNIHKKNGLAVASLIFALTGLSLLAIIFGRIQLSNIKNQPDFYSGKGMARAGVILGWIGLIILILILI